MKVKQRRKGGVIDRILRKYFPEANLDITFVTFGSTVYAPHGASVPWEILQHEMIHVGQQKNFWGGLKWWYRYLRDTEFRFSQELPAYQMQYRSEVAGVLDRNARARIRWGIALMMASGQYGRMCSQKDALVSLNEFEKRVYQSQSSKKHYVAAR